METTTEGYKVYTKEEFFERARKLYGDDAKKWKFKCTGCGRVQSAESIKEQIAKGEASQRHGIPKKGDYLHMDTECYSPTCNWVSYGLFCSGIIVIIDSTKPYNWARVENCHFVFPLADDAEMNEK